MSNSAGHAEKCEGAGCPSCSSTADSFNGVLAHLRARDVTMICVSCVPLEMLLAYRERMGWNFNFDYGVSAAEARTHTAVQASELTLPNRMRDQPAIRADLPRITVP